MDRKYLNIDELSQYLGLKKSLLYSYVEAGEIPHYRIGRLLRFKLDGNRQENAAVAVARRFWLI